MTDTQKPVAWRWLSTANFRVKLPKGAEKGAWNPLYAAPPAQPAPAQRLSDARINDVASALFYADEPIDSIERSFRPQWLESIARPLARAIEAAIVPPGYVVVPGWQPIETAPKGNTEILLSNGVDVSSGSWFDGGGETYDPDGAPNGDYHDAGWMDWGGGMLPEPTHWMPLPPPPAAAKDTP